VTRALEFLLAGVSRGDEVLTEVILPPAEGLRTTYWKLRRRGSFDFPILGVAVLKFATGFSERKSIIGIVIGLDNMSFLSIPGGANDPLRRQAHADWAAAAGWGVHSNSLSKFEAAVVIYAHPKAQPRDIIAIA
jgi:hypothetical protein